MAKRKAMASLREGDRVESEQLSVTLVKGQKEALDKVVEERGTSRSHVIREALESWVFSPRLGKGLAGGRGGKRTKNSKKTTSR